MLIYETEKVRDKAVKLAEKHNVFPNQLPNVGITFVSNGDREIIGICDFEDLWPCDTCGQRMQYAKYVVNKGLCDECIREIN